MHFAKKEKVRGRSYRVCAGFLAVLLVCSMFFAGGLISIEAKAAINRGDTVFIGIYDDGYGDWVGTGDTEYLPELGAWTWGPSSDGKYYRLSRVEHHLYTFTPDETITGFKIIKFHADSDEGFSTADRMTKAELDMTYSAAGSPTTMSYFDFLVVGNATLSGETGDYNVSNQNGTSYSSTTRCLYLKKNNTSDTSGWYAEPVEISRPSTTLGGGNSWEAPFVDDTNDSVTIYPVSATFYDYLTDYEVAHGWRSNAISANDDITSNYETSRTYNHRMPYTQFNAYISSLTGGEGGNWTYPLYFGNITSPWSGEDCFNVFPYGTLRDKWVYPKNVSSTLVRNYCWVPDSPGSSHYNDTPGYLRHDNLTTNYTGGMPLNNFSIFANDSETLKYMPHIDNYSGSVQGLVMDKLKGDQLYMTTRNGEGIASPYFPKSMNGYVNEVKTQFPMRVDRDVHVDENDPDSNTYTIYEFDSNGKSENNHTDIAYFTYNNDGTPANMYYTNNTANQVIDAYHSLGGNDQDHRGFFPFDRGNGSGDKIGYDYGFGMRLDLEFNLTEDGNIISVDSQGGKHKEDNLPMRFTFEGDDDVWVFVDGKLALDLGGDHGNAKGSISFGLNNTRAYVDRGAVTLNPLPEYGASEYYTGGTLTYANGDTQGKPINIFSEADGDYIEGVYNTSKQHTLTVFYMERGLVESNLHLTFSISPRMSDITVDKTVDYSGVNSELQSKVASAIDNDTDGTYVFSVDDGLDHTLSDYTHFRKDATGNYTESGQVVWHDDGSVGIGNNERFELLEIDPEQEQVTVTEKQILSPYYYNTKYTVTDNSTGNTLVNNAAAGSTGKTAKGGGSVTFDVNNERHREYSVYVTNTMRTADVKVTKSVTNDTSDSSSFSFDVKIMLPGKTSYEDWKTITVKAHDSNGTVLSGVPLGSKLRLYEKLTDDQKNVYVEDTSPIEITVSDSTVNNNVVTKNVENTKKDGSGTISATKTLDGGNSTVAFNFALTPLVIDNGVGTKNGTAKTAKNSTGGTANNIKFALTDIEPGKLYNYLLEETSETNEDYTCDDSKYWVTAELVNGAASIKYYNATQNGSEYTQGSEVTSVTFANTSIEKTGSVKVVKTKGDNGQALSGATIALVKAVETADGYAPEDGAEVMTRTTGDDGTAVFDDLPLGNYLVYETKSPKNYELYGEYELVTVNANEESVVNMSDPKSLPLPKTGGIGVVVIMLIGAALIAGGIFLLKNPKKKDDATSEKS